MSDQELADVLAVQFAWDAWHRDVPGFTGAYAEQAFRAGWRLALEHQQQK